MRRRSDQDERALIRPLPACRRDIGDLDAEDVEIWTTALDRPRRRIAELETMLSAAERGRADRFCRKLDRDRFIAARAFLRTVLAPYVGSAPQELSFRYGVNGKPELAGATDVRFNASRSCGLAVCAVTRGRRVGVDVERERPIAEADAIAEVCFSSSERAVWRDLPAPARQRAFLRCWTRKEACLKALGVGLTLPPERVEVTFAPGQRPRVVSVDGRADEATRWEVREVQPAHGWIGAVVIERAAAESVIAR